MTASATDANRVLVELWRGDVIESRHRGAAVAVDAAGTIVSAIGDVARPVLPRSAVKPLQAIAMVESGAPARFALGAVELALACASHAGEPDQVHGIARWLARMGLSAADLVCGGHAPLSPAAARALFARGERPSRLHDNCSGKHAAMLAAAKCLEAPTAGYEHSDHPVQRRIREVLGTFYGLEPGDAAEAVDGCGVPTLAVPLGALARAMARFAAPEGLPAGLADAARRLAAAMAGEPAMVAGPERFDTEVIAATRGAVLAKGGAEGVHVAILRGHGLGLAVKIDDGAGRASQAVVAALLDRLGALDGRARGLLAHRLAPEVRTRAGAPVGTVRVRLP